MSSRPYPRGGSNNASSTSHLATPQTGQRPHSPGNTGGAMSRAERFEDEKRRIVESCFSKLDQNGQLSESYITHIRIIEDAQYPSAPPPPESADINKKPRLIIIAVKSSGRVRMHKARENNNGSFSIGKTWNMEELSAIESYASTSLPVQSEKEAQHRAWAGDTGFTVTILKPYYWQAGTPKEKSFFIASAVKIYRKYTKGLVPDLRGFDDAERTQILGGVPASSTAPPAGQLPRQPDQSPGPAPPQPPFAQRDQSQEGSRYRQSPGPPPSLSDGRSGSGPSSRRPSESPARFVSNGPRPAVSTEQIRGSAKEMRPTELRPGTSPGPGYRSPSFGTSQRPLAQASPSPLPVDGSRLAHGGALADSIKFQGAPRNETLHQPTDGTSEERKPSASSAASGANLFQQARDRYMNYQTPETPTTPTSSRSQIPSAEASKVTNGNVKSSAGNELHTAQSTSSIEPTFGAVAASSAIGSYWISESTTAPLQSPGSPPTPERSKHRPRASGNISQSNIDLRPAPLSPPRTTQANGTRQALESARSNEQSDFVKPLHVQNKSDPSKSEVSLPEYRNATPAQPEQSVESSPAETPDEHAENEEQYRPGLGPMFKKRAIADRFKKAANAANAFKPRPGGAAERILQAKAERDGEPDGITGVVPRRVDHTKQVEQAPSASTEDLLSEDPSTQQGSQAADAPPVVEISSPRSPTQHASSVNVETRRSVELIDVSGQAQSIVPANVMEGQSDKLEQRQLRQPQTKVKRRSAQQEKYLASLGIDRSILEAKGLEFESTLSQFGWGDDVLQPKHLAVLETDLRREQGRVEAGAWLSHADAAREERVTAVETLLDKAIEECDKLESLLTVYHVELSSLNDDITFIEAQSHGLQVQSANQQLLHKELQNLLETMSLDRRVMDPIRHGDLSDPHGLAEVEKCLVRLYQAMLTMDPSMGRGSALERDTSNDLGESETANMSALQEKKVTYDRETEDFCKRLMQFLDSKFAASMTSAKSRVLRPSGSGGLAKMNADIFTEVRSGLWMYGPLVLFTKEVNMPAWHTLLRMYHTRAATLYADTFKENLANWKRAARANTGDETDILFTAQEKEEPGGGGLTSTARKMTVKRSQTLAKSFRNVSGIGSGGEKHSAVEHKHPGAMIRAQAFAGALDEMAPLISREQNFFVDFFHANSLETENFADAVESGWPAARRGTDLLQRKPLDPDRGMAQLVNQTIAELFSFFGREMDNMLNWSASDDPIQGVGVLASLARHAFYLQESNQEFLLQTVRDLFDKLQSRFGKFVDEQIRAIEDTKVKIKKRKGVIAFMKIFPHFSHAVENTFALVAKEDYERQADCVQGVRQLVDEAYDKINRAMFDSLRVIAKESPVAGVPSTKQAQPGDDSEDKEILNYHILLIENMNHYVEDVDDGSRQGVLAEWKDRAKRDREEAMNAYVARVIRRPLGKLLDFVEAAESILSTSQNPSSVSSRPSYSRKAMRVVLSQHDGKEIRRGIDTLRKRIEKHFGEGDEEQISRTLVGSVCKECEYAYQLVLERTEKLVAEVYPVTDGEKDVVIDFSKTDIQAGFRR